MFVDTSTEITIQAGEVTLAGLLHVPQDVTGIVIFAHGSGSSRLSPRNQFIAQALQKLNIATLLFDLLTLEEDEIDERTSEFRFDISLLAKRLISTTTWVTNQSHLSHLPVGYFGASTGAAAALVAASKAQQIVKAVVSRGGRPDLAGRHLAFVRAATLLIIGGDDGVVIDLNKDAYKQLTCTKKIEIVPGATHLFEEPGKLEAVGKLAAHWFEDFLK